jgi:HSP20 family protein
MTVASNSSIGTAQQKGALSMAQNDRKDAARSGTKNERSEKKEQQLEPRRETARGVTPWQDPFAGFWGGDPLSAFRRFNQQMDRWFGDVGLGRDFGWRGGQQLGGTLWSPQIETFQRGDQFIVRADLPGMKKEDIDVEVTDQGISIQGERREEHQEDREGYYRSERSYGSFYRVIPLPEGAITESSKATFKDGVLEVSVQAPPREVSRGRRLEISEGQPAQRDEKR